MNCHRFAALSVSLSISISVWHSLNLPSDQFLFVWTATVRSEAWRIVDAAFPIVFEGVRSAAWRFAFRFSNFRARLNPIGFLVRVFHSGFSAKATHIDGELVVADRDTAFPKPLMNKLKGVPDFESRLNVGPYQSDQPAHSAWSDFQKIRQPRQGVLR